jgi:ribonucleoside-triphosphate reductase (thioredoxin)
MYRYLPYSCENVIANIPDSAVPPSEIAQFTINRTYSRVKINELGDAIGKESSRDIYIRVVNGAISILEDRLRELQTYHDHKADLDDYAIRMYNALVNRRFTPAGRGLWAMGTKIVYQDRIGLPLVNCTFITSSNIEVVKEQFFHFVMDALMLGVGVGFDTKGAGKCTVHLPVEANFNKHQSYHTYINQLNEFRDDKFTDENGNSYIKREIDYINNTLLVNRHRVNIHVVEDSREGWCNALCVLLKSYFRKDQYITIFDYSKVRPEGSLLKGFGGKASGPKPLAELLSAVRYILHYKYLGKPIDELFIIDICNLIARTVVAGNVRRSSEICTSTNPNIVDCKLTHKPEFKYRRPWAWNSNNSYEVNGELSLDEITKILNNVRVNGEPGIFFLNNARRYGRIQDGVTDTDRAVDGTNPCGEISLEGTSTVASSTPYSAGGETCNLAETFPSNYNFDFKEWNLDWDLLYERLHGMHRDALVECHTERMKLDEYLRPYLDDLFIANLYAKIVTLVPVHWKSTETIQNRNRRIGTSMSGISVLLSQMGLMTDDKAGNIYDIGAEESITFKRFAVVLDACYQRMLENDANISDLLQIPRSIKLTTIKPSGTVSICNDVPAGMHFPYSNYYIRRIRISKGETELITAMERAGYNIGYPKNEPNTVVIEFPVKISHETYPRDKVPVDLQFKIYLYLQRYWADNSVSCTFTFKEHEFDRICELVNRYQGVMKGLSCLPYFDDGSLAYEYMPNERISKEKYMDMASKVSSVKYHKNSAITEIEYDTHCDGDKCVRIAKV